MDVNRYVYDPKRGLPICTKTPQRLSKLEKQRLAEREEASREEIAAKNKTDETSSQKNTAGRASNPARRPRRAAASTPRQPTSTRLQENMISAERSHVVDVNSSDEDSDDDSTPAFATDEQIMASYYEVTAANPRKDGKIPWLKITNDLKRKNLKPQTKHKMTKLVSMRTTLNTPARSTRPKRNAREVVSEPESECDSADDTREAPADSSGLVKKLYEEMMTMTRAIAANNSKYERAIKEANEKNDKLARKLEECTFI